MFGAARSGTNAATWALTASGQIAVRNEDSRDCFYQFTLREKISIDAVLKACSPKPVFFKCFHDTPRAQLLFQEYPNSRAIYSIRQPRDCIGSFVNEFGKAGAEIWMERFVAAAKERCGMLLHVCRDDPAATEIAVDQAKFVLDELEQCEASPSNIAACYYLWAHSFADHIRLLEDRRFLILDYDALVANPQAELGRVCEHFSIEDLTINPEHWFVGREFGKTINVAPRLLALCETVYEQITGGP